MSEITATFDSHFAYPNSLAQMPNDPRPFVPDDENEKRGYFPGQARRPASRRPVVGKPCSGPALTPLQKTKADILTKVWVESNIPNPAPAPELFVEMAERGGAGLALVSRAIRSTATQIRDEASGKSRKQYIHGAASCERFLSGKVNRMIQLDAPEGAAA
jgi:hypothetical protein